MYRYCYLEVPGKDLLRRLLRQVAAFLGSANLPSPRGARTHYSRRNVNRLQRRAALSIPDSLPSLRGFEQTTSLPSGDHAGWVNIRLTPANRHFSQIIASPAGERVVVRIRHGHLGARARLISTSAKPDQHTSCAGYPHDPLAPRAGTSIRRLFLNNKLQFGDLP